jgi:hypothetical protein
MELSDKSEDDREKLELEYSTNVSSTIMMKVPTACLVTLRNCFENESDGLNLVQFLQAFVANMDLENHDMLLKTGTLTCFSCRCDLKLIDYIFYLQCPIS